MQKWYALQHRRKVETTNKVQGVYQEKTCRNQLVTRVPVNLCQLLTQTEATAPETLQGQFSGYGSTIQTVIRCLDKIGLKEPLYEWSDETIEKVVRAFIDEKFPTVLALNKIDHPDSDKVCSSIPVPIAVLTKTEHQQNRQDARSAIDRPLLCGIRSLPPEVSKAELHQVCRRQRIPRYKGRSHRYGRA